MAEALAVAGAAVAIWGTNETVTGGVDRAPHPEPALPEFITSQETRFSNRGVLQ